MNIGEITDEMNAVSDHINNMLFDKRQYKDDEKIDVLFKILENAMKEMM
jgi:hypothetical protein